MWARTVIGIACLSFAATACKGGGTVEPKTTDAGFGSRDGGSNVPRDAGGERDGGRADAGEAEDAGMTSDGGPSACIESTGAAPAARPVTHGPDTASVAATEVGACRRSYALSSTAPLRDHPYGNPRTIDEVDGMPILRSGDVMLDALYAMANVELAQASVDSISDGAFDDGRPFMCPPPGCFETGRLWTYVWTRDTAYAADLGLALMDPRRSATSLELKLSLRRDGTDPQIIQDTGSGGSYPVSTDRVSWALGSMRVLASLAPPEVPGHEAVAFAAVVNTVEHDRVVAFDAADGLYRGEHSFLDWREQSYAPWTAADTVHIAMSKALSTNVLHLEALRYAALLAGRANDAAAAARYSGWADDLATRIHAAFWLDDAGLYSSHLPTTLDPAPARRFDLLGASLAVLAGLGTTKTRQRAVASYPHLQRGPPVLWPQSREVPIYHNRAIWPFVTAYAARAAKAAGNPAVVTHAARSLYDGAALNLSNMENLEVESGRAFVDDGPRSGPVVNSQRQLWSVAAFFTLVNEIVFGLHPELDGILRVEPGLTRALRRSWFPGVESIALNDLTWRGTKLTIVLRLPPEDASGDAIYTVRSLHLNGAPVTAVADDELHPEENLVEVELEDPGTSAATMRLVTDGRIFAPPTPAITTVAQVSDALRVSFDRAGANPAEVTWSVYRDGERIASGLPGASTSYDDASWSPASPSHCYAVELEDAAGNASHRSAPSCWWGPGFERTRSYFAQSFVAAGGTFVNNHGREHYEAWGDPGHSLTLPSFTPGYAGRHLIQLTAGNGAGAVNTGITCGIKRVRVEELPSGTVVAEGYIVMPHLGAWSRWADSSFLPVDLLSDRSYRVVIDMDDRAVNMSARSHFERYVGEGGRNGSFFRVNIAEIKVLSLTGNL